VAELDLVSPFHTPMAHYILDVEIFSSHPGALLLQGIFHEAPDLSIRTLIRGYFAMRQLHH
jgi:hypothetical protein